MNYNWISHLTKDRTGGHPDGGKPQRVIRYLDSHQPGWRTTKVPDLSSELGLLVHLEAADLAVSILENATDDEMRHKGLNRTTLDQIVAGVEYVSPGTIRWLAQSLGSILGRRAERDEDKARRALDSFRARSAGPSGQ